MKALIFGASGQDGYYLSKLLNRNNIEVVGISRTTGPVRGDVANFEFVSGLIQRHVPEYIFHFSAVSSTRHEALRENHSAISTGTLNILESARLYSSKSRIFLTGSAVQFQNDGFPISETSPFQASSAYAVARIQSVYAARYFREKFSMSIYVGYLFNHDSFLRGNLHVNKLVVDAAKSIAKGEQQFLELGDLGVQKEFNHAWDIVQAIWILVNQKEIFELIIGGGVAHSIEDWVSYCFRKCGLEWSQHIKGRSDFKSEYQKLVSDNTLLKSMGWRPKISFETLADMMIDNSDISDCMYS